MKITKYNQSCLLVETKNKRILIDPGVFGYSDERLNDWHHIDAILVTHRHSDHCNVEVIKKIVERDNIVVYTSSEVVNFCQLNNVNVVKEGDTFNIGDIKVEVTKAVHGFLTGMKYNNGEIKENIGFIVDDGMNRLYTTSDTINFNHNYKADILCMPFNGNGLTLGIIDGTSFAKDIDPKLLLPIHLEHPIPFMNPNLNVLKEVLEQENINYKILNLKETIEV